MSISPDLGHIPYVELTGNIQIAGHIQSPTGILATTSTRPYLIDAPAFVLSLADLTGLTIVPLVVLVVATQSENEVYVQALPRSRRLSVSMRAWSCSVGLMYSAPSLMKEFSASEVVMLNSPLPKPPRAISCCQIFGSRTPEEKSSSSTIRLLSELRDKQMAL